MKRQFVAGVMGLAVAGCAHFRSDTPKGPPASNPASPVGMQPVPSIYDTINRGTGNPAMAQSALGNVNDPHWAGQAPAPNPNGRGGATTPSPSQIQQAPQMAAARPSGTAAGQWSGPTARPASATQPAPTTQPALAARPYPTTQPALAGRPAGVPDESISMPAGDLKAVAAAAALPAGSSALTGDPGAAGGLSPQDPTAMPPSSTAGMAAVPGTNGATAADPGGASPATSIPSTLERPGGPMPEMLAGPGGSPDPTAGSPSSPPGSNMGLGGALPDGPPQTAPNGPTIAGPTLNGLTPVGEPPASLGGMAPAPADPAVNPSSGRPAQVPAPRATGPQPAGDPLLGPNPDLMPELPPLPDKLPGPAATTTARPTTPPGPSASPAAAAAPPAAGPATPAATSPPAGPADAPPPDLAPSSDAAAAPPGPPASPPPDLGPPSADNRPGGPGPAAGSVQLADLPSLAPVSSTGQVSGATVQQTVASADSAIPVRRATAHRDGQVVHTSLQSPGDESLAAAVSRTRRGSSIPLVKVGDDVITLNDLIEFVQDHMKSKNDDLDRYPAEEKMRIMRVFVWRMVDQYLLVQEARRVIRDPKHFDQFTRELESRWKEDELPQLECQYHADDERQLREKFKEQGRSLDVHYKTFSRYFMSENWLRAKIKNKVKADMPEMLKYYNDHINDKEYARMAMIVWHEILVDTRRYPGRAEARKKVEAIMDQLRRGADFAQLAAAQSDGPSRSREQGGLMETSPGSYGIASVNAALQDLPIGELSGILEGPDSFHIVRVDRRSAAGPAPFEELQDEIRTIILNRKFETAREEYMKKLRDETPVDTFKMKNMERPEPGDRF